jgi:hypothetical protein
MESNVTLTLRMRGHCVQTEAKNEFRRLTGLLLESCDEPEVTETGRKLELLRAFIETADWNSLRSADERLAGTRPGECVIAWGADGKAFVKEISG